MLRPNERTRVVLASDMAQDDEAEAQFLLRIQTESEVQSLGAVPPLNPLGALRNGTDGWV